jgi:hypothetical protein
MFWSVPLRVAFAWRWGRPGWRITGRVSSRKNAGFEGDEMVVNWINFLVNRQNTMENQHFLWVN